MLILKTRRLKILSKRKNKLHNYLKSIQKEIHAVKNKIQKMGGLNELTSVKNEYKDIGMLIFIDSTLFSQY